jgi:hypothetical protein
MRREYLLLAKYGCLGLDCAGSGNPRVYHVEEAVTHRSPDPRAYPWAGVGATRPLSERIAIYKKCLPFRCNPKANNHRIRYTSDWLIEGGEKHPFPALNTDRGYLDLGIDADMHSIPSGSCTEFSCRSTHYFRCNDKKRQLPLQ